MELGAYPYPVADFYASREGKSQVNYGVSISHVGARLEVLDHIKNT
jgi:hypothetical protein